MNFPIEDVTPTVTDDDKTFVKSKDCYVAVKQIFLDHIPDTQFPTYEEWVKYVDNDEIHDPALVGFVPGGTGQSINAGIAAAAGFARQVGLDAVARAGFTGTADEVLGRMRNAGEKVMRERVAQTASKMFETMSDTGDGGTSKSDYIGGSRFNPTGLSQTLKPIDTHFKTDITFQGQTRYWQDGKENSGPLFIKFGTPGLFSTANTTDRDAQLWDFIKGPVTMEWNTAIAKRVKWTGRVVTLMTELNITDYINRCLYVCCVYYFWRSVIAFTDDPRNKNAGMDALRDRLTPTDYNNLFNLRREMMQSAIPPFIHEFCFYMMGTYRQNHLPTSPIMKIMPFTFARTSEAFFSGEIGLVVGQSPVDIARQHLNQLREFNNVLSRAIGDWGGIEPFEYTASPDVDFDYTTFWTNANYICTNATGEISFPRVTDLNSELVYNIHTDAPDGWVSSMVSPLVLSDNSQGVGLFHPWVLDTAGTAISNAIGIYNNTQKTTCVMYNAELAAGFYPVEAGQTFQALSGNTFSTVATSSVFHKFQKFGTERVILTSINALRQANFQFLELLFTQDLRNLGSTAGIVAGKTISPSKSGKNPYGGRKRGGKRKGGSSIKMSEEDMKDNGSIKDEL